MEHIQAFTQQEISQFESILSTEQFKKALLVRSKQSQTLAEFIFALYSYATGHEWDVTKKCSLMNLSLKVLQDLVKSHSKEDFVDLLRKHTELASRRDGNYKQIFNQKDIFEIRSLLNHHLLPFYQLYRIIFDRHSHFRLETIQKDIVEELKEHELSTGASAEVESIPCLQQFLGIRQPKQDKKDAKKK